MAVAPSSRVQWQRIHMGMCVHPVCFGAAQAPLAARSNASAELDPPLRQRQCYEVCLASSRWSGPTNRGRQHRRAARDQPLQRVGGGGTGWACWAATAVGVGRSPTRCEAANGTPSSRFSSGSCAAARASQRSEHPG